MGDVYQNFNNKLMVVLEEDKHGGLWEASTYNVGEQNKVVFDITEEVLGVNYIRVGKKE